MTIRTYQFHAHRLVALVAAVAVASAVGATQAQAQGSNTAYTVTIRTGCLKGAGTDANVHLAIRGQDNNTWTEMYPLDTIGVNDFEKGTTFTTHMSLPSHMGIPSMVYLVHDNVGRYPGWFVRDVKLTTADGITTSFPANKWLASDECSQQTYAHLARGQYPECSLGTSGC